MTSNRLKNIQRIFGIIADLKTDCEIQLMNLNKFNELTWDCHKSDRWKDKLDLVCELETLIIGEAKEKYNENKKKTIREYGKEL